MIRSGVNEVKSARVNPKLKCTLSVAKKKILDACRSPSVIPDPRLQMSRTGYFNRESRVFPLTPALSLKGRGSKSKDKDAGCSRAQE